MPHSSTARPLQLLVTGGGTGGHTYPAFTALTATRRLAADHGRPMTVTWAGTATGLEAKVAAEHGIAFQAIASGKLRRNPSPANLGRNIIDAFKIPHGILQAIWFVARTKPNIILSTGGYVSVPIGIAAWATRRPLVMHEQITTLGLANKILSRFASVIALSHPSSIDSLGTRARAKAVITGNPIRTELLHGDPGRGRQAFGFPPGPPLLYVTGGAQGSAQINTLVTGILPDLLDQALVLHQCGTSGIDAAREVAATLTPTLAARYRPVAFLGPELADVLAAADVVISRSGAGTIAELTALGKPSILIPLIPSAADEQHRNARHLAEAGAAVCLTADQATSRHLLDAVRALIDSTELRAQMSAKAKTLGRPDAADTLARILYDQAGHD